MSEKLLNCPFCGDVDYDLVGLKYHLTHYCDKFDATELLPNVLFPNHRHTEAEVSAEDIAVTIKEWSKIDKDMPYILWDGYFKPIANAVHKKYRSYEREAEEK